MHSHTCRGFSWIRALQRVQLHFGMYERSVEITETEEGIYGGTEIPLEMGGEG